MKVILLLIGTMLSFSTTAQRNKYDDSIELRGNGHIVRETPTVARFDAVTIRQFPATVRVEAGGTETSVAIAVDANLRPLLRVTSENGMLTVAFADPQQRPFWISEANLSLRIKTPTLSRLTHGSNSDVTVTGLSGPSFELVNEANGNITLRGRTGTLTVTSSANGNVDASELIVQTATVKTEANATVRVNSQSLKTTKRAFATVINVANPPDVSPVSPAVSDKPAASLVTIRFRNNSALPRQITLISYAPGDEGNETNGFTLAPYASRSRQYAVGTSVYLATRNQIDLVMSGGRLRDKPLLTVEARDEGRTVKLND